ncbi:MAG: lipid-A-disaccharide synthase [Chitinophagaceae bacterium]|nr:lipid-A-disaccharide synthase [Chitinophagaceae bacterium]
MKYYVIAGEASGDLHGSNLMLGINHLDPAASFRCWGGDLMEEAGGEIVKHYRDLAFMGFIEVIKNLPVILSNLKFCKTDILNFRPDALILIDYPGFNLRIAKWARSQGFKIIYYISPQVWAWKENRVKAIKKNVDKMLVILPFEKSFYTEWKYAVEYVGHPLVKVIDKFLEEHVPDTEERVIALLPGSRKQEIMKKLPVMLEVTRSFPNEKFVVAKAPGQQDSFYEAMLKTYPNVSSVRNETYKLLAASKAALVTSGTATLETALFGVPEVVCYKGSKISYEIAKRLIKIKYISLVNLIMDKEIVKELIQNDMTATNLVKELRQLLEDPVRLSHIKADYASLKNLLSEGGDASLNAAKSIVDMLAPKAS